MAEEEDVPQVRGADIRQKAMQRRPASKPATPTLTPTRILAAEKRRRAVELRKAGSTYEQIANAVGFADASGARKAVMAAMEDTLQEPAMELRKMNVERLNHMLLVLWPKVQAGDERAIDTGLRILDKLDRLMGTEAGQQVDVNVNHAGAVLVVEGDKDAYIAAMRRMVGITEDGTNKPIEVQEALPSVSLTQAMAPSVSDVVGVEQVPPPAPPTTSRKGKPSMKVEPDDND